MLIYPYRAISDGMTGFGFTGISYDQRNPEYRQSGMHDFMTTQGLIAAFAAASLIVQGGLAWWAPPCSNWVFMARGSTTRSEAEPMGGRLRCHPNVVYNNRLVSRMCAILDFLWKRGVYYIIEQPMTSLMFLHKRLKK